MSTTALPALATARRVTPSPVRLLMAAKLAVAALLAATLLVPAAGGFHGQALWLRFAVYPVGLAVLPALWWRRGGAYPLAADGYLLVPFAFDAAGNSLGLYGHIDNFDNLAHLVGTFALCGFAGTLLGARGGDRLVTALAAAGTAALLAIGIELAEWSAFAHPAASGYGAYRDTIGDLAMDVAGAALGALLVAVSTRPPR